jgi:hypothetical protein
MAQQQNTLAVAANPGDTSITLSTTPVNLKPGVGMIIGVRTWVQVANTYTGSSTTVPINGPMPVNHSIGATVQWDNNVEPGLTGS